MACHYWWGGVVCICAVEMVPVQGGVGCGCGALVLGCVNNGAAGVSEGEGE